MAKKQAKVQEKGQAVELSAAKRDACPSNERGQAAMEYLMTYGWAVLVLVAVIAILIVMNPLRPQEACNFQDAGFSCSHQLIDNSQVLMFQITNGFQRDIVVKAMNCTTDKNAQPSPVDEPTATTIRSGETATFSLGCSSNRQLSVGETFEGKLWVFYNWADDPPSFPRRMTAASVVTRVLQAPTTCEPTGVQCYPPNRCCNGQCIAYGTSQWWRICRYTLEVAERD
jgi:hypothetical protein